METRAKYEHVERALAKALADREKYAEMDAASQVTAATAIGILKLAVEADFLAGNKSGPEKILKAVLERARGRCGLKSMAMAWKSEFRPGVGPEPLGKPGARRRAKRSAELCSMRPAFSAESTCHTCGGEARRTVRDAGDSRPLPHAALRLRQNVAALDHRLEVCKARLSGVPLPRAPCSRIAARMSASSVFAWPLMLRSQAVAEIGMGAVGLLNDRADKAGELGRVAVPDDFAKLDVSDHTAFGSARSW